MKEGRVKVGGTPGRRFGAFKCGRCGITLWMSTACFASGAHAEREEAVCVVRPVRYPEPRQGGFLKKAPLEPAKTLKKGQKAT